MNDTTHRLPLSVRSRQSRLCAVQWLFHKAKFPLTDAKVHDIQDMLKHEFGESFHPDSVVLRRIVKQAQQSATTIDEMISAHMPETWTLERLDPVILAICRAAIAEAMTQKTPFKVILREYADITETFYGDKEIGFIHKIINGILTSLGYAKPAGEDRETQSE